MDPDVYARTEELAEKIARLEEQVDLILKALKLDDQRELPEFAEIQGLLKANRKIDAIKLYREKYKASLTDAKTAVERIEAGKYDP